ncbi:hypothetical protein GQ457_08G014470 [Hibiscus cannabinus]
MACGCTQLAEEESRVDNEIMFVHDLVAKLSTGKGPQTLCQFSGLSVAKPDTVTSSGIRVLSGRLQLQQLWSYQIDVLHHTWRAMGARFSGYCRETYNICYNNIIKTPVSSSCFGNSKVRFMKSLKAFSKC